MIAEASAVTHLIHTMNGFKCCFKNCKWGDLCRPYKPKGCGCYTVDGRHWNGGYWTVYK